MPKTSSVQLRLHDRMVSSASLLTPSPMIEVAIARPDEVFGTRSHAVRRVTRDVPDLDCTGSADADGR
jgi:hypothetical protein